MSTPQAASDTFLLDGRPIPFTPGQTLMQAAPGTPLIAMTGWRLMPRPSPSERTNRSRCGFPSP